MYFLLVLLYLQLLALLHYNAQQTPIQHLPNTSLPNLLPPNLLPPNLPPQNVHEGHPPPFANQRFPNGCRNAALSDLEMEKISFESEMRISPLCGVST